MGQPTLIAMNERILGHVSGTPPPPPPQDFAGTDDVITNLAKEREPRSSNEIPNPVLIFISFHVYK